MEVLKVRQKLLKFRYQARSQDTACACMLSGCEAKVQVVDNSSLLSDQIKKIEKQRKQKFPADEISFIKKFPLDFQANIF